MSLIVYLTAAMMAWAPTVPESRLRPIAADIAAVATRDPPAFTDDPDHVKSALLLASLGDLETGHSWAAWIEDGRCNRQNWRELHEAMLKANGGNCDGGNAFTFWQIHMQPGRPSGIAMLRSRSIAITEALYRARTSLTHQHGLCEYSGEHFPDCPKGQQRIDHALRWLADHPYAPGEDDKTAGAE